MIVSHRFIDKPSYVWNETGGQEVKFDDLPDVFLSCWSTSSFPKKDRREIRNSAAYDNVKIQQYILTSLPGEVDFPFLPGKYAGHPYWKIQGALIFKRVCSEWKLQMIDAYIYMTREDFLHEYECIPHGEMSRRFGNRFDDYFLPIKEGWASQLYDFCASPVRNMEDLIWDVEKSLKRVEEMQKNRIKRLECLKKQIAEMEGKS